jgi:molecular chaperone DnaK
MGTNTKIKIENLRESMTPESCSSALLKFLYNYLDDDVKSKVKGTIITIPSSFNQMQKDATSESAKLAGIGKVAFVQEPIAAIMSVMKRSKQEGMFLIYHIGGGTFDVAVAENISGHVNLLASGGIPTLGGADFDRLILDKVIIPRISKKFSINDKIISNITTQLKYDAEQVKINLSNNSESPILNNGSLCEDLNGNLIYTDDIILTRSEFDKLIENLIIDTLSKTREVISQNSCVKDVSKIIFIGGPTAYKPLRDRISKELEIPYDADINPMTAVAEGASIFAESIDWDSVEYSKKSVKGSVISSIGKVNVKFDYIQRTPSSKVAISVVIDGDENEKYEMQIDSLVDGWSSGRISIEKSYKGSLPLSKIGENNFKVFLFDSNGNNIPLEFNKINVLKVIGSVDSVTATNSIGLAVLGTNKKETLEYLIRAGDPLPKKGKIKLKNSDPLSGNNSSSMTINFKLYEGNVEDIVNDNRLIGCVKICNNDIENNVTLKSGTSMECMYEILNSDSIKLSISIPDMGIIIERNVYSRTEGQQDYTKMAEIVCKKIENTVYNVSILDNIATIDELRPLKEKLLQNTITEDERDPEKVKKSEDAVFEIKSELYKLRKRYKRELRIEKLESDKSDLMEYGANVPEEDKRSILKMFDEANKLIDSDGFDEVYDSLRKRVFDIVLSSKDFWISYAISMRSEFDKNTQNELLNAIKSDNIQQIISIVIRYHKMKHGHEFFDITNIMKG